MQKTVSSQAAAAKLIRAELKRNKVTGSVRSSSASMTSSVNVKLDDPLPAVIRQVRDFAVMFSYEKCRGNDLPQARFVFVDANYSDHIKAAAWDYIKANYQLEDITGKPLDADSGTSQSNAWVDGTECSCFVRHILTGFEQSTFWASRKPHQVVAVS